MYKNCVAEWEAGLCGGETPLLRENSDLVLARDRVKFLGSRSHAWWWGAKALTLGWKIPRCRVSTVP